MLKSTTVLCALLLMVFIYGCGGSSPTAGTTFYELPANLPTPPYNSKIGGSVQGLAALTLTNTVSTFAGTAGTAGSADGARLSGASFNQPVGITTDGINFYVADTKNNMIRKINIGNGDVAVLAGSGTAGRIDGTGTAATFNAPTAITYSFSDNCLYVADTENHSIRKVDMNGVVTTIAGSIDGVAGSVDSKTAPLNARFNRPTGITTDGANLYVTDYINHTIRRIDIASKAVTTLAGSPGAAGSVDGAPSAARFNKPLRIASDGKYLYVTDSINMTIRRIETSSGTVKTIAGISGPLDADGNIADGSGTTARFNQPNGITTDGVNLYVTDSFNNSVRRITNPTLDASSVVVSTVITGASAKLDTPIGITTDGTSLFVTNSHDHTIKQIQ